MIYNFIGDIHGRSKWKQLVNPKYINVFLGDYFSPYGIPYKDAKKNFLDIIHYKEQYPDNVILLIGNHDEDHWHIQEHYSRFDRIHCDEICNLFEQYKEYFTIAFNIDNILATHAGVTDYWYFNRVKFDGNQAYLYITDLDVYKDKFYVDNYKSLKIEDAYKIYYKNFIKHDFYDIRDLPYYEEFSDEEKQMFEKDRLDFLEKQKVEAEHPLHDHIYIWHQKYYKYDIENNEYQIQTINIADVANAINQCWKNQEYYKFDFKNNARYGDYYGTSSSHGPLWVRPESLNSLFVEKDYYQVIGHTMCKHITCNNNIYQCDCLEYTTQSLLYNSDTKKFIIN